MQRYSKIVPYDLAQKLNNTKCPSDKNYISKINFEPKEYSPHVGDIITDDDENAWNYFRQLIQTVGAPTYADVFDWLTDYDIEIAMEHHNWSYLEDDYDDDYYVAMTIKKGRATYLYPDHDWCFAADAAILKALELIKENEK